MDQWRKLLALWNWLPAFHAVAESEHYPTASRRISVTASALCRTIKLLETALDRRLFNRVGRTLRLNADGRRLHGATLRAIGALTSGLDALTTPEPVNALYVSTSGALAQSLVVPAFRGLRDRGRPALPHVYAYDVREIPQLLVSGQLDVAFSSSPVQAPRLESVLLGEASTGVYCGAAHPLFRADEPPEDQVLAHAFVVSCAPRTESPDDGFPPGLDRRIEMFVGQADVALQLCLEEPLLAVLPDFVASPMTEQRLLRRLRWPALPPAQLHATFRAAPDVVVRVAPLVDAVREALAGATGVPADVKPMVERTTPGDQASDAWLALGDALCLRGEHEAGRTAYLRAREQRAASGALTKLDDARCTLKLAQLAIRRGRYAEAEALGREGLLRLEGTEPVAGATLQAIVCMARCFRGDAAGAEKWLSHARGGVSDDAVVKTHPDGARARAFVFRAEGNWLIETGRAREAVVAYERGWTLCDGIGDAWERSIALFNMAEAWSGAGEYERARALLDAAERDKKEIGDRWGQAYVRGARAALLVLLEDAPAAVVEATAGLQLAAELEDPKLLSMLDATLGVALFACDDSAASLRAFRLALADAERCDARKEAIRAWLGLCALELRRKKKTAARRAAAKAHALALDNGSPSLVGITLFALADVAIADGQPRRAAELYRAAFRSSAGRSPALSPFDLSGSPGGQSAPRLA
jgi:DNA-binding transcriptional LysR family regulator